MSDDLLRTPPVSKWNGGFSLYGLFFVVVMISVFGQPKNEENESRGIAFGQEEETIV